ncbi:glycosyltransferase [Patescibacteria group bacterium]|nr:glycosyltransferase [Patescibacteria group bacterium]
MENKRKILYLVTQSEWGGAQKYIYNLATNLPDEFSVLVAFGEGNDQLSEKLKNKQIPTIKLKYLVRRIQPFYEILAFFEVIKLLKKEKPDIIHLNSSKIGVLGSLAGKLINLFTQQSLLIIYTVHGWVFNEPLAFWLKKLYYLLEKISASWKDKIIIVSDYDYQIAINNKLTKPEKFITIHNQLNPTEINFLDRQTAQSKLAEIVSRINPDINSLTDYQIIGTIANLYPTKGLEYLIKAAPLVIKENPKVLFLVLGEGQQRNYLESLINKYQLNNNFFLLGEIKNAGDFLQAFDLFVLSSVKEGLPYTILEAKAADLPIIATKVGGIPEIIDQMCLVEPKNHLALAEKIIKTCQQNINEGKEGVSEKSFQDFLAQTISLYR